MLIVNFFLTKLMKMLHFASSTHQPDVSFLSNLSSHITFFWHKFSLFCQLHFWYLCLGNTKPALVNFQCVPYLKLFQDDDTFLCCFILRSIQFISENPKIFLEKPKIFSQKPKLFLQKPKTFLQNPKFFFQKPKTPIINATI